MPELTRNTNIDDETAAKLFALSKLKACREWPYFLSAIMSFVPVRADWHETVGIDKYGHVYYNPAMLEEWGVTMSAGVIAHECGHWLRLHSKRAEAQGVGQREHDIWNIACDCVINRNLRDCGIALPEELWYPEDLLTEYKLKIALDLAEEEYYFALKRLLDAGKIKPPKTRNCGSGAHNIPVDKEIQGVGEGKTCGLTEIEGNSIRRQVAKDIINFSKSTGKFPSDLKRWAEDTLDCKIRWERQLSATIRQAVAFRAGINDFTYSRPSRRQQAVRQVVLPSMHRPVPKIGIIIDTSGSVAKSGLDRALSETKGVLKSIGRTEEVFVLSVDAEVGFAKKVFSTKQIELVGGGGTNMIKGFDYIKDRKIRPNIVILFTDGYTSWPAKPLPYKVICVLIGELADTASVPTWMKTVRVVD